MEQAIDQDFSKSLLAQDLIDVDNQLNHKVCEIQKLQEAEGQYIGEESIEIRHQILEGKKSYVELMGDKLDLKRAKLSTKLNYLKRLMRKRSVMVLGLLTPRSFVNFRSRPSHGLTP